MGLSKLLIVAAVTSAMVMASHVALAEETIKASLMAGPASTCTLVQTAEQFPSKDKPDRLKQYTLPVNSSGSPSSDSNVVKISVDPTKKYQTITGFGGAFTDSVAHVFDKLNDKLQEEVLESLWGATGQHYNLARLTIGSTDFSVDVYNYDEEGPDYNMEKFSIDHDKDRIIPLILRASKKAKEAAAARGEGEDGLRYLSTSWSPPGWMKRGWLTKEGYMRNSAKPGMIDDPKIYESYALYLSKYLTEYKAAGVNISMMTIQNEPDSADHQFPVSYPCCNFNGTGEGDFLAKYLGPKIRKDHPDVAIYVHDGQKFHDVPILTRVEEIVAAAGGLDFIDGAAFHWYGKNLDNYEYLEALHEKYPTLKLMATEATLEAPARQVFGTTPWKEAQKYSVDIIGDLNAHAEGWIEWNVLLTSAGGPTCIGPTSNEFCTPLAGYCDAPILADTKNQKLEYRDTFWHMGHFSRFIPRGSVRVAASNTTETDLMFTAAVTPKNELIVVVLNTQDNGNARTYELEIQGKYVRTVIPGHGIHTIKYDL